jgi:hypothetical protein
MSFYAVDDGWAEASSVFLLKQFDFVTQCKRPTSDSCTRQFARQIGITCTSLVTQLILTGCFFGDSLSPSRRGVNNCSQKRTQRIKQVAAHRLFSAGSSLRGISQRVVNTGEFVSETLPRKSRKAVIKSLKGGLKFLSAECFVKVK